MKSNKFMLITSVLSLFIMLAGATFAWFAASTSSGEDALGATAAVINLKLDILPLYVGEPLIPTNDSDIGIAMQNSCVDQFGNGACSAYTIKVKNAGGSMDCVGSINFTLEDITNFKYRLLDEDDNLYIEDVVESGTDQSLGDAFTLDTDEEKIFTLILWVPNLQEDQSEADADGHFGASVSYQAVGGSKVTGTFSA